MDYWRFEDVPTREKWERISRQIQSNGYRCGIGSAPFIIHSLTHAFFGTTVSLVIIVKMLLSKSVKGASGAIAAISNSPYMWLAFAAALVGYALLSYKNDLGRTTYHQIWNEFWGKKGKRYYNMTGFTLDNKKAMDMKIYNFRPIVEKELSCFGTEQEKTARKSVKYVFGCGFINSLLTVMLTAFSYCFVGIKSLSGAFGIGSVVLYATTLLNFNREISYFSIFFSSTRANLVAYEDQFSYINTKREMNDGTLSVEKRIDGNYCVEFKNVSFKYPRSENYALHNVSIKFDIGQKLAVVGMNGSGKTTFIKLMCRLYDPTEGEILLNGIDIKKYKYDDYMAIFSVVFQDFRLFNFPLAQNVAASKEYDKERVSDSLCLAGMSERVKTLPYGIDTCLFRNFDPEGVEISGGEAQKIALARALYKNAPFIILDEPTAALDPIAEAEIYSKFNEIIGDKTAIYISHRLSSCRFCDKIVVFDNGKIAQAGNHDELVSDKGGKYYELWHAQAQYYT